jgi:hypothetical protein
MFGFCYVLIITDFHLWGLAFQSLDPESFGQLFFFPLLLEVNIIDNNPFFFHILIVNARLIKIIFVIISLEHPKSIFYRHSFAADIHNQLFDCHTGVMWQISLEEIIEILNIFVSDCNTVIVKVVNDKLRRLNVILTAFIIYYPFFGSCFKIYLSLLR